MSDLLVSWGGVDYWALILCISCLGLVLNIVVMMLFLVTQQDDTCLLPASLPWILNDFTISIVTICTAAAPHLNCWWNPLQETLFLDVELNITIFLLQPYFLENSLFKIQQSKWIPLKQLGINCILQIGRETMYNGTMNEIQLKVLQGFNCLLLATFLISSILTVYMFKTFERNSQKQKIIGFLLLALVQKFTKLIGLLHNANISFISNLANIVARPIIIIFWSFVQRTEMESLEEYELNSMHSSTTSPTAASQIL